MCGAGLFVFFSKLTPSPLCFGSPTWQQSPTFVIFVIFIIFIIDGSGSWCW